MLEKLFVLIAFVAITVLASATSDPQIISLQGGATALEHGASGVFINPASLRTQGLGQVEAGVGNLAGKSDFFANWAFSNSPTGAMQFGVYSMNPNAFSDFAMHLSGMVHPVPNVSFGAHGRILNQSGSTAMDINGGMLFAFTRHWTASLTGRNLAESLDSIAYRYGPPGRSFVLGSAYTFDLDKAYSVYYDAELFTENKYQVYHHVGARLRIGPVDNLEVRGGATVAPDFTVGAHGGARIQEQFFSRMLYVEYGANANEQAVSIGMFIHPTLDVKAPLVAVRTDVALFSPQGRGNMPTVVHFFIDVQEKTQKFTAWHLVIYKANAIYEAQEPVRRFHGKGKPPRSVRWFGEDGSADILPPGMYAYRIIVTDAAGNVARTVWQNLEIQ
jgi:hypothetical protein